MATAKSNTAPLTETQPRLHAIMTDAARQDLDRLVRRQAVNFIHADIHERYRMENIHDLAGKEIQALLEGITQEDIDHLESLFTSAIYPDVDSRQERDKSFESLIAMLKTPTRLTRIVPSMPAIILRYASIWPAAFNVGINTMLAYLLSVRLENDLIVQILALLEQRGIVPGEKFRLDEQTYRKAYLNVPYAEGRRMITHAMRVIKSGKEPRVTKSTYNILSDVQNAFTNSDKARLAAGQPSMYADAIQAINFGKETLKKIEDTFSLIPPERMNRLIKITRAVELAYLDFSHGKKSV